MTRSIAEQSQALSIFWLKKHGYLNKELSYASGGIRWTYGYDDKGSSISFSVHRDHWSTPQENTYVTLKYTHTNPWTGEKSNMEFNIELTTTECNYGGERYWFICPLVTNGNYCGRRVGVIYSASKWFGCRYCGNIAYQSQFESGRHKGFVSIPDIDKAEAEVKRYYYKGKPTRKYMRVIKLNEKFERSLFRAMAPQLIKK